MGIKNKRVMVRDLRESRRISLEVDVHNGLWRLKGRKRRRNQEVKNLRAYTNYDYDNYDDINRSHDWGIGSKQKAKEVSCNILLIQRKSDARLTFSYLPLNLPLLFSNAVQISWLFSLQPNLRSSVYSHSVISSKLKLVMMAFCSSQNIFRL
jgi:hypothetical protein